MKTRNARFASIILPDAPTYRYPDATDYKLKNKQGYAITLTLNEALGLDDDVYADIADHDFDKEELQQEYNVYIRINHSKFLAKSIDLVFSFADVGLLSLNHHLPREGEENSRYLDNDTYVILYKYFVRTYGLSNLQQAQAYTFNCVRECLHTDKLKFIAHGVLSQELPNFISLDKFEVKQNKIYCSYRLKTGKGSTILSQQKVEQSTNFCNWSVSYIFDKSLTNNKVFLEFANNYAVSPLTGYKVLQEVRDNISLQRGFLFCDYKRGWFKLSSMDFTYMGTKDKIIEYDTYRLGSSQHKYECDYLYDAIFNKQYMTKQDIILNPKHCCLIERQELSAAMILNENLFKPNVVTMYLDD
jgi:hypothetical protein